MKNYISQCKQEATADVTIKSDAVVDMIRQAINVRIEHLKKEIESLKVIN